MHRNALILTAVVLACTPAGEEMSATGEAESAVGPRVASAPTGPGEMPPAIIGQGGALEGAARGRG